MLAPGFRRFTALSLVSCHATAITFAGGVMIWAVGGYSPLIAVSQTALPPDTKASGPKRPTAQQLVDEAKQRLRDRGELPPAPASPPNQPAGANPAGDQPLVAPATVPAFNLYRLGVGDAIAVVVQRFPDLSFQAALDQQGFITHPLLRKIYVQGLTVDEAQAVMAREVNKLVIDPVVLVSLVAQRPILVTITGEIGRPGLYNLSQGAPPRVAAALLQAGGTTQRADLRIVKVQRPLPNGTLAEQIVDLIKPLKEGTPLPDLRLQDGDVVTVPRLEPGQEKDYDRSLVARSFGKGKITVRYLSYSTGRLAQVDLPIDSTFVDALTAIGPTPDSANMRKIALIRFDSQQNKAITRELDGKKALLGDPSQNLALEDNDVIVIGRNLVGKLTYALNTFTQPFRDVLGFLLFFKELRDSSTNLFRPNNGNSNGN
jgi:polysaccharide biosynthesis/export protein